MRKNIFVLIVMIANIQNAFCTQYSLDDQISCDDLSAYIDAVYELSQYKCAQGYYLPANIDRCVACPTGAMCGGGTFVFNPNEYQGLDFQNIIPSATMNKVCAANFLNNPHAVYEPNQHTCNPGYYMPANYDGCARCLADSYCAGGTYAFNETVTQGAVSCASGLYAPAGMWESAQCGRILHIGDEVVYLHQTKKTSPALHIDVDNDGVADFFGNVTTLDVPMTNVTQRKLKLSYGGQTYSVYDDSVDLTEYESQ